MRRQRKPVSRVKLVTALIAIATPIWIVGQRFQATTIAQATTAQGSNFTGGAPTSVDATAVRTTRLRFAKGSRSNWHSHTWGQLLMIEEGRGRTQVRGGPLLETVPGQPWWTAAGVEHWHGAAPDQDALQLTIYEGTVKWLEAVTDQQYLAAPRK
jgi:quercetin dioxygenase-like cupin family protein